MKNIAFYYPGHIWHDTDSIKSLLLFFDGIGFVIPEYKKGVPEDLDPVLAGPLRDNGLLHYFVADEVIDADVTKSLTSCVEAYIESGVFDSLAKEDTAFHSLSMSRLGYYGDAELAENIFRKLREKGLAKESEDGSSIPMHPMIRYLILILLSQLLRGPGHKKGFNISPVTDRPKILNALTEVINLSTTTNTGKVVQFDLQAISADLRAVPLDEVLDFKNQYKKQHELYMRSLRVFAREISGLPDLDQEQAIADRQAELDDYASDIKRASRKAWQSPAIVGFGLAGALLAAESDPMAALLAAGGLAIDALQSSNSEIDAYSYLLTSQRRFY